MITSKQIIGKIRASVARKDGRFVCRGTTTAEVIGYPSDTRFEIWDDMMEQRTYHVPTGEIVPNQTTYTVISDRWSGERISGVTMAELQELADLFSRDRFAESRPAVTINEDIYNGCDVIKDDTGDIVAVSDADLDQWENGSN